MRPISLFHGLSLLLCGALLAGCRQPVTHSPPVAPFVPPVPPGLHDSLSRFQHWRGAVLHGWLADGIVISTRFGETGQLHVVNVPGGTRRQITFFDEPVEQAAVCPDPRSSCLIFAKDSGGDENFQLFSLDLRTNAVRRLTDGKAQNGGIAWRAGTARFAYASTRRNGKDWDLYLADLDDPSPGALFLSRGGAWSVEDWSPDGKRLLVSRYISADESRFYIADGATAALTPVGDTTKPVSFECGRWAGDRLLLVCDRSGEFRHLWQYDPPTRRFTDLTPDLRWNVRSVEVSRDGRTAAINTNEHGYAAIRIVDLATRRVSEAPGLPRGVIYNLHFSPDGRRLGFTVNRPTAPDDVYSVDIPSMALTRWTFSETGPVDTARFVTPRIIEFPTFDSTDGRPRRIPCHYYQPRDAGKHPALILIHGGPESQYWPYYTAYIQFLAGEKGVAVLAPDMRGSNGYGRTFLGLDNGYKREDAVRDIGGLLDWIAKQPGLDPSRVAVDGGSYGGYMALAVMARYNDRLRAGICINGIADFVTFLEKTNAARRDLRRAEYGDERDPAMRAFLERISPVNNAPHITRPMLIVAGANDPRVPREEAERIVTALRTRGADAWYLLAGDEGHTYRRKINRDRLEETVADFLLRHLAP